MPDIKKSPKREEELHALALERFQEAEEFEREDRRFMEEDLAFAAGEQWPTEIKHDRERKDRPCLTFNRLPVFCDQVINDGRQNKPAIRVHPVEESDKDTAELYEGLIRNIEVQSRATRAYINAFEHSVKGGRGAWRVITEYAEDDTFDQDIRIRRIADPFAVFFDPGAKEYDKSDANWCFVSEWITQEAFDARYPGKAPSDWIGEYRNLGILNYWVNHDRVRLAEYWVKEPVTKTLSLLSDGTITDKDLDPKKPIVGVETGEVLEIVRQRKVETHKVVRYLLSGHTILEGPQEYPSRYIPIIPCFGPEEFLGDRVRHRSLIRYAKDSMRMYNFWQSSIAEKVALSPKQPWLVTADMIKGYEQFWNASNTENRPYLPYSLDDKNPNLIPQRQAPANVNAAEIQQSAQAIDDLKASMGIFDASLGAAGNESSGRAILARQREGDTATFAWIDNLARSIEHTGRILVDMIPRIYDTQRIIRVIGEDESSESVEINIQTPEGTINDITTGKYDVVITVGPSYQTKRIEAAESLIQFVQALPQAGEVAGDLIARNMDWPGAEEIAERLKKMLPPKLQSTEDLTDEEREDLAQRAEQEQQNQQRMFEADVATKEADAVSKRAKAQKDLEDARAQDIENDAVEAGIVELLSGQAQ